jgi:hypothetical protein
MSNIAMDVRRMNMQRAGIRMKTLPAVLSIICLCAVPSAYAELKLAETESAVFTVSPTVTTDIIMIDNVVDLDSKKRDDRFQYLGLIYTLDLDIKGKDEDPPELFFRLERYGPYNFNVPAVINNTLETFSGKIAPFRNAEYLPELGEFWMDIPLTPVPVRVKAGLFSYSVGHGIALGGEYNNYAVSLYTETDDFEWHLYYAAPDFANKNLLGPYIKQNKPQGINWEHSKTQFVATDLVLSMKNITFQPYTGILVDRSEGKRNNLFTTPTRDDLLGTVGGSIGLILFKKLSLGFEAARNFGQATKSQEGFDDVKHQGYMFYADAVYDAGRFDPHIRGIYGSGNKLTGEMTDNGDTTYTSSKNNAFSIYSPFNTFLADSIYQSIDNVPLVAMGNGDGINYGIRRPGTFGDPIVIENLILINAGFDYDLTEKAAVTIDWWYLSSAEKGIGVYNGISKVISPDLGHEFDIYYTYAVTKNITFTTYAGVFFPGAAYREERTDTGGDLFTPFVRGDGKADPAYQAEFSLTVSY